MDKSLPGVSALIQRIVAENVHAYNHPVSCNMFPKKPCTLLTCAKNGCRWTKQEAAAAIEAVRNRNPCPFPLVKPNRIARFNR